MIKIVECFTNMQRFMMKNTFMKVWTKKSMFQNTFKNSSFQNNVFLPDIHKYFFTRQFCMTVFNNVCPEKDRKSPTPSAS